MGERKRRSVLQSARADGDGMRKPPGHLSFIRDRWNGGKEAASHTSALRQAWLFEQEWGEARKDVELDTREAKRIKHIAGSSYDVRSMSTPK